MSFARCLSSHYRERKKWYKKNNAVKRTHLLAYFFKNRHPRCCKMAILQYNPVAYLNSLQENHHHAYMSLCKLIVSLILPLISVQFLLSQFFLLQVFDEENRTPDASFETKLPLSSNVTLVVAHISTSRDKERFLVRYYLAGTL